MVSTKSRTHKAPAKMRPKITSKLERFTPTKAKFVLESKNYEDNRKISAPWVEYLARQMKAGLWRSNGEALIFDVDDNLLDGQHRLSAVVESGITVDLLTVKGIDTEAFTTIDQGKIRTAGQVFKMQGEKYGMLLAAACRKIYAWEILGTPARKARLSPDELALVLECYPEIRDSVVVASKVKSRVPVDGSMVAFCHWLFKRARPKKVVDFFDSLESGQGKSRRDPAVVLRDRLFRERSKHRRWGPTELFAIFTRAWNYYDKGQEVSSLAIKPDRDGTFKVPTVRGLGRSQGNRGGRDKTASFVNTTPPKRWY